ncbi:hypothetical protein NLX83_26625 [Allokutzneria sp. A3M-2-11 16]|uniref:hypothetical protein n=1 Tax=Allokutzneria sp. A3M-2-11 16 TaxID=2962043 RepID=UPI0020B7653E|nr:hypothetical protein [Allokutzneria sp. A3M-2-11 16]MCP3802855.1 hypothetical protein [Allokutzneria sp. A3M-2-11 16]
MFAGLDKIDWLSLEHAYGPAEDVPEILRGLVSADPGARELAYEDFADVLHHGGDVYEPTALAVPFLLEAVCAASTPRRHDLLNLLASVGGVDETGLNMWAPEDPDPYDNHRHTATARASIGTALTRLIALFDDPDPEVRRALPAVLVVCQEHWGATISVLRQRLTAESDPHARAALVRAVGMIAPHLDDETALDEILAWIAERAADHDSPIVQLRALATLAEVDPGALPANVAEVAIAAVDGADVGHLVRSLDTALSGRVAERTALMIELLSFPSKEIRRLGSSLARGLVREWRGDHSELARRVGDLLADPELARDAAETLDHFGPDASPAADALVAAMDGSTWLVRTLARTGDERALSPVREALERKDIPFDIGSMLYGIRAHAAPLLPVLCARLRDVSDEWRRGALLTAIGNLEQRGAEAAPDLVELLESGARDSALFYALRAVGPAAQAAVPLLRRLCDEHPFDAPLTLWRITGDPAPALAAITAGNEGMRLAAALGPAATGALPLVRARLEVAEPWALMHAAIALWEITSDPEPVVPALLTAWRGSQHCRIPVARFLAEIGHPARAAEGVLRAELGQPRRHNVGVYFADAVGEDLELLHACTRALGFFGPSQGN